MVSVVVVGATGYAGSEVVRLLARHPNVRIVGLVGRNRDHEPIGSVHPHLAWTGLEIDSGIPESDAVFLALPHGASAAMVPELAAAGRTIIDLGPDFRLRDAADYPRWYHFDHPAIDLLDGAVYGLPELHRAELTALRDAPVAIVGAPGLLPHGHAPRSRPARTGRAHRRSRRRREERRVRRGTRREGRPDVRRGQRERESLRADRPSACRGDRAGAGRARRHWHRTGRARIPAWRSSISSPTSSR